MRDSAILLGNSSSGVIEAASFGTPVLDIGPRQQGRQHSANLRHADYSIPQIRRHLHQGHPPRFRGVNVYGKGNSAQAICRSLARWPLVNGGQMKLITY
jgi:GDP/UDP-N,N'-diacetylbacillosamine 2-epimerase (hydrolysing)